MSSRFREARTIGSGPRAGHEVPVGIDAHVTGLLRHASGPLSTLIMSFDLVGTHACPIECTGRRLEESGLSVREPHKGAGVKNLTMTELSTPTRSALCWR